MNSDEYANKQRLMCPAETLGMLNQKPSFTFNHARNKNMIKTKGKKP